MIAQNSGNVHASADFVQFVWLYAQKVVTLQPF